MNDVLKNETWLEIRRDVFSILLMCVDGYQAEDAVAEADNLIRVLDGDTPRSSTLQ